MRSVLFFFFFRRTCFTPLRRRRRRAGENVFSAPGRHRRFWRVCACVRHSVASPLARRDSRRHRLLRRHYHSRFPLTCLNGIGDGDGCNPEKTVLLYSFGFRPVKTIAFALRGRTLIGGVFHAIKYIYIRVRTYVFVNVTNGRACGLHEIGDFSSYVSSYAFAGFRRFAYRLVESVSNRRYIQCACVHASYGSSWRPSRTSGDGFSKAVSHTTRREIGSASTRSPLRECNLFHRRHARTFTVCAINSLVRLRIVSGSVSCDSQPKFAVNAFFDSL